MKKQSSSLLVMLTVMSACADAPADPQESTTVMKLCTEDNPGCDTRWIVGESTASDAVFGTYGVESIGCGTMAMYTGFASSCWASFGQFTAICDVDWNIDGWGSVVITGVRCYTF